MPLPRPRKGEKKDDFIHRCMGDGEANKTFPDQKQRNAVCFSQWDEAHKGAEMFDYPLREEVVDTVACFRAHLGLWAIEPYWLREAVQAVKLGLWPMKSLVEMQAQVESRLYATTPDGVAIVRIVGGITKGVSKFTGTSAILTRRAIRQAVAAEDVQSILLAIDSPGGQVDGVQDVADEVARAKLTKPVLAYIEDLGASAAYWIASQAQRITANKTAEIGSIGVLAAIEDTSGKAAREGVVVHIVTTSPYKAVGAPGTQVLPEHLAYLGEMVQTMGGFFFEAVQQGRRLSDQRLAAVADGRVFIAAKAQELGLIDGIESFDQAIEHAARMRRTRRTTAAQHELAQLRAAWETLT